MAARKVDTHQHFWNLDLVEYSWLIPAYGPLYRTYGPHELEPQLKEVGVDATVVVQSANSYADTNYMLRQADKFDWIEAVIGWVPLSNPREAIHMLDDKYCLHPKFRGMRHLIHEEQDPDWLLQPMVIEGLKALAERDLVFEVVAVFPGHLKHVPAVSEKVPNLRMVIDHLAKPPIKDKEMGDWADQFAAAAENPNVYAKVSGLNTAADWENWTADDIKPYIEFAVEKFGANRLMFGGDWPVCVLAGDYAKVWNETNVALAGFTQDQIDAILGGTAEKFYNLAGQQ